jgi:hypothetical protein
LKFGIFLGNIQRDKEAIEGIANSNCATTSVGPNNSGQLFYECQKVQFCNNKLILILIWQTWTWHKFGDGWEQWIKYDGNRDIDGRGNGGWHHFAVPFLNVPIIIVEFIIKWTTHWQNNHKIGWTNRRGRGEPGRAKGNLGNSIKIFENIFQFNSPSKSLENEFNNIGEDNGIIFA